jgi:hypothetical protein
MTGLSIRFFVLGLIGALAAPDSSAALLEDYESCGLNSLFLTCQLKGVEVELGDLRQLLGSPAADGAHSFAQLSDAAAALGLFPLGLKATNEELAKLPMPAIVQVRYRYGQETPHLLVLLKCNSDGVYLLDAPHPHLFDTWQSFEATWTGNVLVFTGSAEEQQGLRERFEAPNTIRAIVWTSFGAGIALVTCGILWQLVRVARRSRSAVRLQAPIPTFLGRIASKRNLGWLALLLLLAGSGATYGMIRLFRPHPGPSLVPEKSMVDLGELGHGEQKAECLLRNDGDEMLALTGARSNCSCAKIESYPQEIAPGQTGVVHLTLQVAPGPRSAKITLQSNDPRGAVVVRVGGVGG